MIPYLPAPPPIDIAGRVAPVAVVVVMIVASLVVLLWPWRKRPRDRK